MDLPFRIDFSARKPLSQQATDGFRLAIKEGVYRDGEALPSLRDLARRWNVSVKVPGMAYSRLADEGYVVLRPGVGAVASRSGVRSWNGTVLFVSVGLPGGLFLPLYQESLRNEIESANMRFYSTVVPTDGTGEHPDFNRFKSYLDQPYDCVVIFTNNARLRKIVRRHAARSVVVGNAVKGAVDPDVVLSSDDAERRFAADCVHAGIRHVRVMVNGFARCGVVPVLKESGVRVEQVRIRRCPGLLPGEGVERAAHDYWTPARLERGNLPDLVYFADDHHALGSLIAFAENGLRIPDDMSVVTWSNRGSTMPFNCELARIEFDPISFGRDTARQVLASVHGRKPLTPCHCSAKYKRAESFPL